MSRKDYVCCIILLAVVEIVGEYSVRDKITELRRELKELVKAGKDESTN